MSCNNINCSYTDWSELPCLGDGTQIKTRTINIPQQGNPATTCSSNYNDYVLISSCNNPVNCQLSPWSEWSPCSSNQQIRTRYIVKPPKLGGDSCPNSINAYFETQNCTSISTTAACGYSNWSNWSNCSTVSGIGQQIRTRTIQTAGTNCSTNSQDYVDKQNCNTDTSQNCELSDWSWSPCSTKCGTGFRIGTRRITNNAKNGGTPCPMDYNSYYKTEACTNNDYCPVNCSVGVWGECNGTNRTRTVVQTQNCGTCDIQDLSTSQTCTIQIPVTTGLYARYTGDGPFTKTGNNITIWNDIGGSNRHITTYRGAPTQVSISKGLYGTTGTGSFNVVSGTINDGFKLPFALQQNNNLSVSSYTIVYIARYTGDKNNITANKRIFDSTATVGNHIWGFHNNINGQSHNANYGWRTYTFQKHSDPDYWMIGIETELNSRFNGIDWTLTSSRSTDNYITPQKSTTTPTFSINYGAYSGDGNSTECSNWQVAELIFYDRELSLNEKISLENFLALKYGHISFANVVPTLAAYKLLTNNTGVYSGWYNIWDGSQYAYYNSLWIGPGLGKFVTVNNLPYFGILYYNGAVNQTNQYANRNNYRVTYNIKTPSNVSKIHILCGGGGGGGGAGTIGGGGGAGGMCYIANATNLSNLNFSLVVGACGHEGMYYNKSTDPPSTSGGDSTVSWTINSSNNSLTGNGGNEGVKNTTNGSAGGTYTITNVNSVGTTGGGNGGTGVSNNKYPPGGAIFKPTTQIINYINSRINNLWDIAFAFGVQSMNITSWWGGNTTGNGGNGSGYGGGYARNGTPGGGGWILFVYDNNV